MAEPYELVLMPTAVRALETKIKPAVAFALYEFMSGALCGDPRRLGKALKEPFLGYLSARRGEYRVIYRIDDATHTVRVLMVDHRAGVYHPR